MHFKINIFQYFTFFVALLFFVFCNQLFSQEDSGQSSDENVSVSSNQKIEDSQSKNKKIKKKHIGKYDLGISLGFSFGFYPISSSLHEAMIRQSKSIENFKASSLDNGSHYNVNDLYGTSLGFQFEYHVHKAKFLFFRFGFNVDFPFAPYPKSFVIKTKELGVSEFYGLNEEFTFRFTLKDVYKLIVPFLVGFEHLIKETGTGFYFGMGLSVGINHFVYEESGARSTSCYIDYSTGVTLPILPEQTQEDCKKSREELTGNLAKILLKTDKFNVTKFNGIELGGNLLFGIKQRIFNHLYIFAEFSINLGLALRNRQDIVSHVLFDKEKSNVAQAYKDIKAKINSIRAADPNSSLLGSWERDQDFLDVMGGFLDGIDSGSINALLSPISPGNIANGIIGFLSQVPIAGLGIQLEIGYSWRMGLSYLF